MFWRKSSLQNFHTAPILTSGEYIRLKQASRLKIEKSLVIVLSFFILFFQFFKRLNVHPSPPKLPEVVIFMEFEEVPITRQGVKKPKPPRPAVPIPVEEPSIPEDLTIEPTELDFTEALPDLPEGEGFFALTPPEPIYDVFPEYPKGVEGEIELSLLVDEQGKVKNVQVIRNTTRSKLCEQAVLKAAYQTLFNPAKRRDKYVAVWIHKTYRFGLK